MQIHITERGITKVLVSPGGVRGASGAAGWSPVLALEVDGVRIVQQVTDWVGGQGTKPAVGEYVGPLGLVATPAEAVNVRGSAGTPGTNGTNGTPGTNGAAGTNGWTPAIAVVTDGERRVAQIVSWVGGAGSPPAIGYIGPAGIVATAAEATDLRGPAGAGASLPLAPSANRALRSTNTAGGVDWSAVAGQRGSGSDLSDPSLLFDFPAPAGAYSRRAVFRTPSGAISIGGVLTSGFLQPLIALDSGAETMNGVWFRWPGVGMGMNPGSHSRASFWAGAISATVLGASSPYAGFVDDAFGGFWFHQCTGLPSAGTLFAFFGSDPADPTKLVYKPPGSATYYHVQLTVRP